MSSATEGVPGRALRMMAADELRELRKEVHRIGNYPTEEFDRDTERMVEAILEPDRNNPQEVMMKPDPNGTLPPPTGLIDSAWHLEVRARGKIGWKDLERVTRELKRMSSQLGVPVLMHHGPVKPAKQLDVSLPSGSGWPADQVHTLSGMNRITVVRCCMCGSYDPCIHTAVEPPGGGHDEDDKT